MSDDIDMDPTDIDEACVDWKGTAENLQHELLKLRRAIGNSANRFHIAALNISGDDPWIKGQAQGHADGAAAMFDLLAPTPAVGGSETSGGNR